VDGIIGFLKSFLSSKVFIPRERAGHILVVDSLRCIFLLMMTTWRWPRYIHGVCDAAREL